MYRTMQELVNNSLRIYNGMLVVNPFSGSEQPITISDILLKFPTSTFARNNSTVNYVFEGDLYAIPYTKAVEKVLKENRYFEEEFKVFFGDGSFPREEQQYWFNLLAEAMEENRKEFMTESKRWCEKHDINPLPSEILDRCMLVPDTGIEFQNVNYTGIIMPVINMDKPNEKQLSKLGTFNCNNGSLCFVYIDGRTFIAHRSKEIVSALEEAGFKRDDLYVPMSNGERMVEPRNQRQWESLKK